MPFLISKRLSLRFQRLSLAGIAAGLAGLVAFVVCIALGHQYNRELRHSTLEYGRGNAATLARVLEDQLDRVMAVIDRDMRQADGLIPPDMPPEEATTRLLQVEFAQSLVRSISLIDATGRVLASSNPGALGMTLDMPLQRTLPLSMPLRKPVLTTVWNGFDLTDAHLPEEGRLTGRGAEHTALPVLLRSRIPGRYLLAVLNPKYLAVRHQQIIGNAYNSTRIYSLDGQVLVQTNLPNAHLGTSYKDDPIFARFLPGQAIGEYFEAGSGDPVAFRASEQTGTVIKVQISAAQLFERVGTQGGRVEIASLFGGLMLLAMAVCVGISLGVSKRRGLALRRINKRLAVREAELRAHRDDLASLVQQRTSHLERATLEAEQANRAKSEFLANMSHELRTPMHAILSFSQFGLDRVAGMENGPGNKMERYFSNIHASGQRLLELLNDLLDLSKLEAGRMEMRKQPCCLRDISTDVAEEMRALLQQARLECVISVSPAAEGGSVVADAARIRQVVHNLMGNALKFTPAGGTIRVEIDCGLSASHRVAPGNHFDDFSLDDTGHAADVAILRVIDNGVGIPADELDMIFDKFAQSTATKTGGGGTGLGLAICREIVGAHGGSIRAYNNPAGAGAVFEVELPLDAAGACDRAGSASAAAAVATTTA